MAVKGSVRTFTSKGRSAPGISPRTGNAGLQLGVRDPNTGRIFRKPQPKTDIQLLRSGGSVRVVNPRAMDTHRRPGGLGQGPANSPRL